MSGEHAGQHRAAVMTSERRPLTPVGETLTEYRVEAQKAIDDHDRRLVAVVRMHDAAFADAASHPSEAPSGAQLFEQTAEQMDKAMAATASEVGKLFDNAAALFSQLLPEPVDQMLLKQLQHKILQPESVGMLVYDTEQTLDQARQRFSSREAYRAARTDVQEHGPLYLERALDLASSETARRAMHAALDGDVGGALVGEAEADRLLLALATLQASGSTKLSSEAAKEAVHRVLDKYVAEAYQHTVRKKYSHFQTETLERFSTGASGPVAKVVVRETPEILRNERRLKAIKALAYTASQEVIDRGQYKYAWLQDTDPLAIAGVLDEAERLRAGQGMGDGRIWAEFRQRMEVAVAGKLPDELTPADKRAVEQFKIVDALMKGDRRNVLPRVDAR